MTDRDLAIKCLSRTNSAYQELYNMYHKKLIDYSKKFTRTLEDAEDVVQEAYINIFKKIELYSGKGSFEGWIKTIIKNIAFKKYTKFSYKNEKSCEILDFNDIFKSYNNVKSSIEHKEILNEIEKLPSGYKNIFKMNVIYGYSHEEIAKIMDITDSASRSQLVKARRKLKEKFQSFD